MKAVLFDFNGTLFDDTRFHLEAWQKYMGDRFGMHMTLEEVRRRFIGPNNREIFHDVLGDGLTEEEIERYSFEKEEVYRAVVRSNPANMHLMEGAPELFDLLAERGIPFALATASARYNVDFYLDELGMDKWFDLSRIVYDEGLLPSKPDPAFYLEAARRIHTDPADCIIVEDSPAGIQAAVNARAGRIIAIDRTMPKEKLEANPAIHAIVHDYVGFEIYL